MAEKPSAPGKNEYVKLAVALIALFLILGAFILFLAMPLISGTTVVLAVRPIDPFDPLRGQYMTIAYEIGLLNDSSGFREGNAIYVSLAPDSDGVWRMTGVSASKPEGVFIKGTARSIRGKEILVDYGIEQYFFERGATFPNVTWQRVTVEAKIDKNGRARITNLMHDRKPITIAYRKPSLTS